MFASLWVTQKEPRVIYFMILRSRGLVSTNARFLEEDYVIDNKPRSKVILYELRAKTNEGNEIPDRVVDYKPCYSLCTWLSHLILIK